MDLLIFGYGSLMNSKSLAKTSRIARIVGRVELEHYQRKANAMSEAYPEVAMNIVPRPGKSITGVLIEFPLADLSALQRRETGYEMVDVSAYVAPSQANTVHTFVAPDQSTYDGKMIHQEYLDVCLGGVPEEDREQWLAETIIECQITDLPRQEYYKHA